MSDATKFDLSRSRRYVSEKLMHRHLRCPMCDAQAWAIEIGISESTDEPISDAPVHIYKTDEMYLSGTPSIPALAFTCTNCGFIRLHNLAWIKKMLAFEDGQSDDS